MTLLSRPSGVTAAATTSPVASTLRVTAPAFTQSYLSAVTEPLCIASAVTSTEVTPYKTGIAPADQAKMDEVVVYNPAEDHFQKQLDALSVGWKRAREEDQQLRESEKERFMKLERDQRDWNERSQLQAKASADGIDALAAVLAAQVAQQAETNRLLASIVNRDREPAPVTEPDTPLRTSSRAANARPGRPALAK